MSKSLRCMFSVIAGLGLVNSSEAATIIVPFTQLTGIVGGSPAGTAVYRADLSSVPLTQILSLAIQDNSFGLGGAYGRFSGFDLDAIKLSSVFCTTAACASGAPGFPFFDFTAAGAFFTPGSQREPFDATLFGTDVTGGALDDSVATLGIFDGNSTTAIPGAHGFLSMGDGGILAFNLTGPVSPSGLYLYIGEVGDNGEVAAGAIKVSDTSAVPEPATVALVGAGFLALAAAKCWRRRCHMGSYPERTEPN